MGSPENWSCYISQKAKGAGGCWLQHKYIPACVTGLGHSQVTQLQHAESTSVHTATIPPHPQLNHMFHCLCTALLVLPRHPGPQHAPGASRHPPPPVPAPGGTHAAGTGTSDGRREKQANGVDEHLTAQLPTSTRAGHKAGFNEQLGKLMKEGSTKDHQSAQTPGSSDSTNSQSEEVH